VKGDGSDLMAMKPPRQVTEDRMTRVGCDPVDDELAGSHPDGQGVSLPEEFRQAFRNGRGGRLQGRMSRGIHIEPVNGNGQLDQELSELLRHSLPSDLWGDL
jgi:hypothetical protein